MKKLIVILVVISAIMLFGCEESLDKTDTSLESGQEAIDQAEQKPSEQINEKCNEYMSGVASGYNLYVDCVDNELTEAMKSGEPYYCEVNMDTQYTPAESSVYEFWVLGDLMKYTLTITFPEEVQTGTYILKPEGTYIDPSGNIGVQSGDVDNQDWIFTPASEKTPYYNVAGYIKPPSTVTCEKGNFGEEMFETS